MKRLLVYTLMIGFSAFLFSCAGEPEQTGESSQAAAAEQKEQTISKPESTTPPPQTRPETPAPEQTVAPPPQKAAPINVELGNEIGNDLGDFVNYDPDSTLRYLSDLRGKMVMVMLWNSLCHHCVIDNEKYREIYLKYNDKSFVHGDGFEIYAIGLDKERSTWIDALNSKQYPWKNNVYVIDSWKDRDIRFFGIRNLPGTLLIDRNGIVVNKLFTPAKLDELLSGYMN